MPYYGKKNYESCESSESSYECYEKRHKKHKCRKYKVLFTGSYNRNQLNVVEVSDTLVQLTGLANVSRNYNGINYLNIKVQTVETAPVGGTQLFDEHYVIASYNSCNVRIGQIYWQALYPNEGGDATTTASTEIFDVSSASGIYKDVVQVSITFNDDGSRNILFLGEKKKRY